MILMRVLLARLTPSRMKPFLRCLGLAHVFAVLRISIPAGARTVKYLRACVYPNLYVETALADRRITGTELLSSGAMSQNLSASACRSGLSFRDQMGRLPGVTVFRQTRGAACLPKRQYFPTLPRSVRGTGSRSEGPALRAG